MSHWIYKNEPLVDIPEGVFGFVYQITNLSDDRKYIGRKYVTKSLRKAVKKKDGTKAVRKRKVVSESNWRAYTGSCEPLNKQIELLGKERFRFEILCLCPTKGTTNFAEEFCQMRAGVIFDDSYYNDSIGARGFIGVKFNDEFKEILRGIDI